MKQITGLYNSAYIFADDAEEYAEAQVKLICDQPASKGPYITCMPDIHPGKNGPIGLCMPITDYIMPGLLGNDIGCGVMCIPITSKKKIEYDTLDNVIKENLIHRDINDSRFQELEDWKEAVEIYEAISIPNISIDDTKRSYCTLGSGNHFIEIGEDEEKNRYLIIHTGSRYLGERVSKYYMNLAHATHPETPYAMTYISEKSEPDVWEKFNNDEYYTIQFAYNNRLSIAKMLDRKMKLKLDYDHTIDCAHNYLEVVQTGTSCYLPFLHKGCISACEGQYVVIPINMKDGVIIGKGKGNPDWNYSAPHGAGRIMNRKEVPNHFTVSQFKKEMKGIHAVVDKTTLEESPMIYRNIDKIREAIEPTVEITKILKPLYNFKNGNNS